MNNTIKLIKILGSPFESSKLSIDGPLETAALLDCATNNKIALYYFESLLERKALHKFLDKFTKETERYNNFCLTLTNICDNLNRQSVRYGVVKTLMPYHAIPNDVDIILFDDNYSDVLKQLKSNGYEIVGEVLYEAWLHDSRDCSHGDSKKKDVYDVDLYNEIGASYLVYLQKHKMKRFLNNLEFKNMRVGILAPECELLLVIFHSVFPEQIFTLSHFYDILYQLHDMSDRQIDVFLSEIWKNNMVEAARAIMSYSIALHYAAFSSVPSCMEKISSELKIGLDIKNNLVMPHKHSVQTLVKVLSEKMIKEHEFRRCMLKQVQSMADVKIAQYVMSVGIDRRQRNTY